MSGKTKTFRVVANEREGFSNRDYASTSGNEEVSSSNETVL